MKHPLLAQFMTLTAAVITIACVPLSASTETTRTVVVADFLGPQTPYREMYKPLLESEGADLLNLEKEQVIAKSCGVEIPKADQENPFFVAAGMALIGKVVDLALDAVDEKLAELLEEYSRIYEARAYTDAFYARTSAPERELLARCWQMRRVSIDARGVENVALDLVGRFVLSRNGDALRIVPLRLYFSNPLARSSTRSYGVSVSVQLAGIWVDGSVGRRAAGGPQPVLTTLVTLPRDRDAHVIYFTHEGQQRLPWQPLPAWSAATPSTSPGGVAELRATLAVSGTADRLLEAVHGLFGKSKNDLATLIKDAAMAALQKE